MTTVLDDTAAAAGNASLTSLAAAASAIGASSLDNTAGSNNWVDIECVLFYAVAPSANKTFDVYLLESLDGTNFADGTAGGSPLAVLQHQVGAVTLRNITTAHRLYVRGIPIGPFKYNLQVVNSGDQALAVQNTGSKINITMYK